MNTVLPAPTSNYKKFILNLSKRALTDSVDVVLIKYLNLSIRYSHSNLNMECSLESVVSKLPQTVGLEFK
jgi:hypothetical protein